MTTDSAPLHTREIIAQATRLLRHLNTPGHAAHVSGLTPDQVILLRRNKGLSLGSGTVSATAAEWLKDRGLLHEAGSGTLALTDKGRTTVARLPDKPEDFTTPHTAIGAVPAETAAKAARRKSCVPRQTPDQSPATAEDRATGKARTVDRAIMQDNGERHIVRINEAESPLSWLHKRRDRSGEPFIDATCFEAGERLRRDMTVAGIMPRVTARWSPVGGGSGGPASATDAMIAARQRLRRALTAVDGDYAGILLDVCGFLKRIEDVERDRRWPPRSGKVVLKLALRRLAIHYGMAAEAHGPDAARGITSWQADRAQAGQS